MAFKLSGLASGMDTESMVKELMKAQRIKSTKIENKITKMGWSQEKWKGMNTKIYSFYTGPLAKLRMQGNFNTKKVSSSNESKAEISATSTAPGGAHLLKIKQLASAQFATGAKLDTDINGKAITTSTKLTDMGFAATEGTTITIEAGVKQATLDIGPSTTINDYIGALKDAGLNATYDTTQKRFFISSKESGLENTFSITTSSSENTQDRNAIRDFIKYDTLSAAKKDTVNNDLVSFIDPISTAADKDEIRTNLLTIKHGQVRTDYIQAYVTDQTNIDAATASERARLEEALPVGETLSETVLNAAVKTKLTTDGGAAATAEYDTWEAGSAPGTNVFEAAETGLDTLLSNYETDNATVINQTNNLSLLGLNEIVKNGDGTVSVSGTSNMVLVNASDATVIYNGTELTSSSNNFAANGLNFILKSVTAGMDTVDTADDETINFSITNDTQAVFDMVKNFVKSYNELSTEMNTSYYATSAKGFEPLSDDEKETMSESQIDKWEEKIKDSLLRRDDTLSSLLGTMRTILNDNVEVDGKKYSLSNFGISSANYTEKGFLHINGDADDSLVSSMENDLMTALTDDPDTVMKVFNELSDKLYSSMTDKMSSSSLRSALTFYSDKEMTKTVTKYKEDLNKLEDKLTAMENRYYKQFAAMETAMAKMNSQSSSLMSMLGVSQ